MRKATTNTNIKKQDKATDKLLQVTKKDSMGLATSINTGNSYPGVQSSNGKKQRFKVNPTTSFSNIDDDVTPKSDLNLIMQPNSSD